jgi:hypothetical protein
VSPEFSFTAATNAVKIRILLDPNKLITESNETNNVATVDVPPIATNGACLVRSASASLPSFSDPDLGTGYAKLSQAGVKDLTSIKTSCTTDVYASLLKSYCTKNTDPVQQQVAIYDQYGKYLTTDCGAQGCDLVSCPEPVVALPDLVGTFTLQPTLQADGSLSYKIVVTNKGTASAGPSRVGILLIKNDGFSQVGTDGFDIDTLAPGASSKEFVGTFSPTLTSQGASLFVAVDVNQQVKESSETNNEFSSPFIVK